jgi:hypothetical protein
MTITITRKHAVYVVAAILCFMLFHWLEHVHIAPLVENILVFVLMIIGPVGLVACYIAATLLVSLACTLLGLSKGKGILEQMNDLSDF